MTEVRVVFLSKHQGIQKVYGEGLSVYTSKPFHSKPGLSACQCYVFSASRLYLAEIHFEQLGEAFRGLTA